MKTIKLELTTSDLEHILHWAQIAGGEGLDIDQSIFLTFETALEKLSQQDEVGPKDRLNELKIKHEENQRINADMSNLFAQDHVEDQDE